MCPFESSLPCSLLSWLEMGLVGVGLCWRVALGLANRNHSHNLSFGMYVDIGSAVVLGKNKKEIIVMNF
jgi:hypothetical protein